MIAAYSNPYYGQDFFGFFLQLGQRCWDLLKGNLGKADLVSDELQIFVLMGIAASAGLVGTFLMLRRMAMLANSLSHTILLGIVIAYIASYSGQESGVEDHYHSPISTELMLSAALAMGLVTTYLTELLTSVVRLQPDAANGLVFTSLFALGIVLITLFTRNIHVGTEVVMGNANLLHISDLKLTYIVLGINLLSFFLFYKEFQITTFDATLAQSLGISSVFFNYLLMTQVSATAIGAFRAVGVLMVLAFIITPPLTARLLSDSLKGVLGLSVAIGCLGSIIGVALSRHLLTVYRMPLSTAGLVVCVITALYFFALLFSPSKGIIAQAHLRQRLKRKFSLPIPK